MNYMEKNFTLWTNDLIDTRLCYTDKEIIRGAGPGFG